MRSITAQCTPLRQFRPGVSKFKGVYWPSPRSNELKLGGVIVRRGA